MKNISDGKQIDNKYKKYKLMRVCLVFAALCLTAVLFFAVPETGRQLISSYPEFKSWYIPWLVYIFFCFAPVFACIALLWNISSHIKNEELFTSPCLLKWSYISKLFILESIIILSGNIVLLAMNMHHPGIFIMLLIISIAALCVSYAFYLVAKYTAAVMEHSV